LKTLIKSIKNTVLLKNKIMKTSILKRGLTLTLFFFSLFCFINGYSQTVTTIAGSNSGYLDALGLAAKFNGPAGVAVDNNGNVFVADRINHRIRKINTEGVVSTFAGSGVAGALDATGTAAQFEFPTQIAIDLNGNIFVADAGNHRIRKITSTGVVTTLAGSTDGFADGVGNLAQFYYPEGVAVDNAGNVYVADAGNHVIRKITAAGVVTTLAGSGDFGFADGAGNVAKFYTPCATAVDASGIVYVTEKQGNRIRKVSPTGVVTTLAGNGTLGYADGPGNLAEFNAVFGVTLDLAGNLYVTDAGNNRIRKITSAGVVTTFAGSASGYLDGVVTAAKFYYPVGICMASDGTIFIGESGNHKIRKISSTLGIDGYQLDQQLSVYPNPTSTSINLKLTDLILSEITLFDLNGKSVAFKDSFNGENTLNLGNLQNGFYTLKITTDKGIVYKKILKN
jgi:serine/threonine-protein kinase